MSIGDLVFLGALRASSLDDEGNRREQRLLRGRLVGELEAFTRGLYHQTVWADRKSGIACIPPAMMRHIIRQAPSAAAHVVFHSCVGKRSQATLVNLQNKMVLLVPGSASVPIGAFTKRLCANLENQGMTIQVLTKGLVAAKLGADEVWAAFEGNSIILESFLAQQQQLLDLTLLVLFSLLACSSEPNMYAPLSASR